MSIGQEASVANWELNLTVADTEAMESLGRRLGQVLQAGDLLVLTGQLGAGKTTLTRGIGEGLNIRGPVTSPTFVLARTHPSLGDGPSLVHVDAYRISDARELDDLDLDFDQSVVVAEWGAGKIDGAVESWLEMTITPRVQLAAEAGIDYDQLDAERDVRLQGFGRRWTAAPSLKTDGT